MPKVPLDISKENYQLRSTFFYGKLRSLDYFNLFMQVQALNEIEGGLIMRY